MTPLRGSLLGSASAGVHSGFLSPANLPSLHHSRLLQHAGSQSRQWKEPSATEGADRGSLGKYTANKVGSRWGLESAQDEVVHVGWQFDPWLRLLDVFQQDTVLGFSTDGWTCVTWPNTKEAAVRHRARDRDHSYGTGWVPGWRSYLRDLRNRTLKSHKNPTFLCLTCSMKGQIMKQLGGSLSMKSIGQGQVFHLTDLIVNV